MFREMLRKKQAMTEAECIALLEGENRGVLSVLGDDGYPYGMPMNHFYCPEDGCLYFHCGKTGHRVDALARCSKASFCTWDAGERVGDDWALHVRSVVAFGRVECIDDPDIIADIAARLSRKFTDDEAYIAEEIRRAGPRTLLLRMRVEHMTGKRVSES